MTTYGYIRTSRDQEPGHPGSDPEVQRRQLVGAGVEPAQVYADVAASGAKDYNSRDQWHLLDELLAQGDVLVVVAIDRLGRRYLETMWAIYDLQRRGIRLRSLADNEVEWTRYLDADPDSPEAFMGNVLASMAAYVASQERPEHQPPHQGRPRRSQGEGRGAGPAAASHRRAAHRHPARRGGRDAGGGGG